MARRVGSQQRIKCRLVEVMWTRLTLVSTVFRDPERCHYETAATEFICQRNLDRPLCWPKARLVTNDLSQPLRLGIRIENAQTWILTDQSTGSDVGGVTYQHNSHGDHYQPWMIIDGVRTEIGVPFSQLGQAAREIEGEVMKRAGISAKRD